MSAQTYERFSLSQRVQHWVMTFSFLVLAVTGLPQRYALAAWAEWLIAVLGGIERVRIVHRMAAVIFVLVFIYHLLELSYKLWVLRLRPSILPGLKDMTDLLDALRYNLGLTRRPPQYPRYSVVEKIEYWALIWGAVLMGVTGFMLWNPIATARWLPGEFIPAAKTTHSAEALLAVLSVLIWHVYWVHLKHLNRAMFTGRLTREEMAEEHGAELAEIEAGLTPPPVPREVKRRRERAFLPLATVAALAAAVGLYTFVTFEQTAITTVPPAEPAEAYVPATPTPTATPTVTPTSTPTLPATAIPVGGEATEEVALPPPISHGAAGFENCLPCHTAGAAVPYPADHQSYGESTCRVCHLTEGMGPLPAAVQHELAGREDCLLCHARDLLPDSHQQAEFTSPDCLLCHAP